MSIEETFKQKAEGTAGLFLFKRSVRCVGKADFSISAASDPDGGKDPDIYNGTFVSTHGFARLAYHVPTNTLCLIASKTPVNVRGVREEEHKEIIHATEDGLAKSYILAAYRLKEDGNNDMRIGQHMRNALEKFGIDMGERSEKHFRLYAGSYATPEPVRQDAKLSKNCEIFTNGCVTYLLDSTKKGYRATFHAAAQREEGHFVPFRLGSENPFAGRISKISKIIAEDKDYASVRAAINGHWGKVSARLWDQKSLYQDEGALFRAKQVSASAVNYVYDNALSAATTAVLCAGAYTYNPNAGLGAAVAATVGHTIAHKLTEDGLHGTLSAFEKAKRARARINIDAYPIGEDASDHFKIQKAENMGKLCPKMDMSRFKADEFVFLDAENSHMLLDHETIEDGMQPENLRGLLVNAHLRGFTSTCLSLDKRTQLDVFQSGLVRLMHEPPREGRTIIYAQYRPELCEAEHLRLPQVYVNQFNHGIVRMEYDREGSSFRESIDFRTDVPYSQIKNEMERILFRAQPHAQAQVRSRSVQAVKDLFSDPEKTSAPDDPHGTRTRDLYAYTTPDVKALD